MADDDRLFSVRMLGWTVDGVPCRTGGTTYGIATGLLGVVRFSVRTLLCSCGTLISGKVAAVSMVPQSGSKT